MSDEDRRLFEQAVEKLSSASRSKIGRLKSEGRSRAIGGHRPGSTRLDRSTVEVQGSIDLHGQRRQEAEQMLRRFLAERERGEVVLVVHGKGSGALRDRVRQVVGRHPRVAESRVAPPRLGGGGALLVRLKR